MLLLLLAETRQPSANNGILLLATQHTQHTAYTEVAHTPRWPVSPLALFGQRRQQQQQQQRRLLLCLLRRCRWLFLSLAACCTCTFFLHYGVWKNFRFSRI